MRKDLWFDLRMSSMTTDLQPRLINDSSGGHIAFLTCQLEFWQAVAVEGMSQIFGCLAIEKVQQFYMKQLSFNVNL